MQWVLGCGEAVLDHWGAFITSLIYIMILSALAHLRTYKTESVGAMPFRTQ
jgi:hypothetical protein